MVLRFILLAIEVISSVLLIILILMQKTRSEGLGLAFGAGMGETLFGSRAGNVLTKATIVLTTVFLLNTLFLALAYSGGKAQSLMERRMGATSAPRQAPAAPAAPAAKPTGAQPPSAPATAGGAPTLPGAKLDDSAAPVQAAPVEAPAAPMDASQPEAK